MFVTKKDIMNIKHLFVSVNYICLDDFLSLKTELAKLERNFWQTYLSHKIYNQWRTLECRWNVLIIK